jgi:hypothetical protein
MDSSHAPQPRYFPVSLVGGRLSPHPGGYLRENQLDTLLMTKPVGHSRVRSSAELDEACAASRVNPLPTLTLWVLQGLEEEVRRRQNASI